MSEKIPVHSLSEHVVQFEVPTPTLPPSFHTNCYLIHDKGEALIVDAGTSDADVLHTLIAQLKEAGAKKVRGVVATHYHRDHTHGLQALAEAFRAPLITGEADRLLAAQEMHVSVEAISPLPTRMMIGDTEIQFQPHPGHTHGHVHILIPSDSVILVGDHLAGDGSVWVGPPDGHMEDYYVALDSIRQSGMRIAGAGHGKVLHPATEAAATLKQRRLAREEDILKLLATKQTAEAVVEQLYGGSIPVAAMWVARKTVQAHLLRLLHLQLIERTYNAENKVFQYQAFVEKLS